MNVDTPRHWHPTLARELEQPYFRKLEAFVDDERKNHVVFPPEPELWTAFALTPFAAVRVVWLGQDPYPTAGQAHGLSFSVKHGQKTPASLANMFKEAATVADIHGRGWDLSWVDRALRDKGCEYIG